MDTYIKQFSHLDFAFTAYAFFCACFIWSVSVANITNVKSATDTMARVARVLRWRVTLYMDAYIFQTLSNATLSSVIWSKGILITIITYNTVYWCHYTDLVLTEPLSRYTINFSYAIWGLVLAESLSRYLSHLSGAITWIPTRYGLYLSTILTAIPYSFEILSFIPSYFCHVGVESI